MTSPRTGGLAAELREFRQVQTLAYECGEEVAAQLKPGVTEREAARMQRRRLRERGVRDWFHLRFAWFGDRTAFVNFRCSSSPPIAASKREEILAVTDSADPRESAFRLDDDLPRVRRWVEEKYR